MVGIPDRLGMEGSLSIDSPFIGGWDAEGLFGGFAGTGDRDGAGWCFAARGGRAFRGQRASAVKWLQRWEKRSAEAKPRGGSVSPLEEFAVEILEVVRAQPDATFVELLVVLNKRGIHTSRSALWRFLGRHDITFKKKSLCASERQRQDVVRARRHWIREQGLLDPARLVFIDETSVNTQMVRLYGHGPRGVRLVDHVPFGNRRPSPLSRRCGIIGWSPRC